MMLSTARHAQHGRSLSLPACCSMAPPMQQLCRPERCACERLPRAESLPKRHVYCQLSNDNLRTSLPLHPEYCPLSRLARCRGTPARQKCWFGLCRVKPLLGSDLTAIIGWHQWFRSPFTNATCSAPKDLASSVNGAWKAAHWRLCSPPADWKTPHQQRRMTSPAQQVMAAGTGTCTACIVPGRGSTG